MSKKSNGPKRPKKPAPTAGRRLEEWRRVMRPIYVPIADSFFESSIMQEELPVRFVMLALIRLSLRVGADGVVDVDLRTFAGSINIPVPDVERAIQRLMEPDPASGCPDEEGRRIVPVNPERPMRGWRLVNAPKYRHIVHLANDAARKRKTRHDEKDPEDDAPDPPDKADASENVRDRPRPSGNGATKYEGRSTRDEVQESTEPPSNGKPGTPGSTGPPVPGGACLLFDRLSEEAEGEEWFEQFMSEEGTRVARELMQERPEVFANVSAEDLGTLWNGTALRGTWHDRKALLLWARDPDGFMAGSG